MKCSKSTLLSIALVLTGLGLNLAGYRVGVGTGDSMQPAFNNPSINVVRTDFESLERGDVVVHSGMAHRVVMISNGVITTKGDNNAFFDPPVNRSEIDGVVVHNIP